MTKGLSYEISPDAMEVRITGPQGSGKTKLVTLISDRLKALEVKHGTKVQDPETELVQLSYSERTRLPPGWDFGILVKAAYKDVTRAEWPSPLGDKVDDGEAMVMGLSSALTLATMPQMAAVEIRRAMRPDQPTDRAVIRMQADRLANPEHAKHVAAYIRAKLTTLALALPTRKELEANGADPGAVWDALAALDDLRRLAHMFDPPSGQVTP